MPYQEKRLRVNMGLKNLRDKVKQHQEKVGEKVLYSPL
jgi:choline-phosphate cytidylyltransferase